MKLKTKLIYLILLLSPFLYGQMEKYNFKRELFSITDQWHKIEIPDEIYRNISPDLADIRIYGLTTKNDTIEAPYILQVEKEKITNNEIAFKMINHSFNEKGYYYTFEISREDQINQIILEFDNQNFDRKLNLQGSQDLKEWFTIVNDYRILSIKNKITDYKFTAVKFQSSRYQFYRIHIIGKEDLKLRNSKIDYNEITEADYRKYGIKKIETSEDKKSKYSVTHISLASAVPVSFLKINVKDVIDFYRPVTIQYLSDSIETQKGWKYIYRTLNSGTLSSLEQNNFKFKSTILKELKIIIQNYDNKPLNVSSFNVKGYLHNLIARFDESADYYLVYDNNNALKPNYDINRFIDNIPGKLALLELGDEQIIDKYEIQKSEPLFKNQIWLWGIIILIILLLGWFTVKMMKNN